jgi:endogenous inhibitor of DNA gyrase (YacG/DUF329 family)
MFTKESKKRLIEGAKKSGQQRRKQRLAKVKKYNKAPAKCMECNKSLPYDKRSNKFCSKRCSAIHNNLKRNTSRKPCAYCESSTDNFKFCSKKCETKFKREQINQRIEKSGIATGASAKPYLIEKRGHKCEICGTEEWRGCPVPLVRDHINGNADDNRIQNQRLVCPNCDAQLPTFAGRNYGNGRAARRKIYKRLGYC